MWVYGLVGGWINLWGQVKSLKILKCWPNQDNSILFEDLLFVETLMPMGGCVGGWVGQWVGSGQMTKNLINLDLIEIIQFCLKIYDQERHSHPWVGGWVGQWVRSGQMT